MPIKSFYLSVFLLLSYSCSFAQAWEWAKTGITAPYGINGGEGVKTDASGNIYVVGTFWGNITFDTVTLFEHGGENMCLLKYNPNGAIEWGRSANGYNNAANGEDVSTDLFGNVYVVGEFYSDSMRFGTVTLFNTSSPNPSSNAEQPYLVKYDAAGNAIWGRNGNGTGNGWARATATDAAGNIYIAGEFEYDSMSFGTITVHGVPGQGSIFLVKYDSSGNVIWGRAAEGLSQLSSIAADKDGSVYMTGSFFGAGMTFGTTTLNNSSADMGNTFFLVKYDSTGSVKWAKTAGGYQNSQALSVACGMAEDGGIYVTGCYRGRSISFDSIILPGTSDTLVMNTFIARYDGQYGNVYWAKRFGGNNYSSGSSVTTNGNGEVYFTGSYSDSTILFDSILLTNLTGGQNIFLSRIDADGNIIWAADAQSSQTSHTSSVTADAVGNEYVTGAFGNGASSTTLPATVTFGGTTLTCTHNAYSDVLVAKYNHTASGIALLHKEMGDNTITLYPNPTNGDIGVSLPTRGYSSLKIFDCLGRVVNNTLLSGAESETRINLSGLPSGIYYLQAMGANNCENAPFIIKR